MVLTNKKAIASISLGHFVADMYASALVPLYPFITSKLGISLTIMSLILSIGHLSSSAMQPLFGFLADQSKHRTFMIWGLAMGAFFIPLTVLAPNVLVLAICLILGMCGNSLFHPQATSMISVFNYNNPQLTKYMGIFLGIGTIGYAISPMLSSSLVQNFGAYALLYIMILGLCASAILYFTVPKIPFKAARRSKEKFSEIMLKILKSKEISSLILVSVMKSVVTISFGTYMPFLLKFHGYTLGQIGLIMTGFFTFAGIAAVLSAKVENLLGAKNVVRLSFLAILPMTLAVVWLLSKFPIIALLVFMVEGFFAFLSVSVIMCAAQRLMPEHRGVISGAVGGFAWSVAALSLAPLGYLAEGIGVAKVLTGVGFVALLVGLFGINKKLEAVLSKEKPCVL